MEKFSFYDFYDLSDGEIRLEIKEKIPADPEKDYCPAYELGIFLCSTGEKAGRINLRIGDNENLFYGGHIGYAVDEAFRGHHYAAKACNIAKRIALFYGMEKLIITCNPDNWPSRKTCERIGAKLVEIADLPEHNEMYKRGDRQKCRYEWDIRK